MAAADDYPQLGAQRGCGTGASLPKAPGGGAATPSPPPGTWVLPGMSLAEVQRRSAVLERYLHDRDWDGPCTEFSLQRAVVQCSNGRVDAAGVSPATVRKLAKMRQDYPLILDHEWDVVSGEMHQGRGDFILASADGARLLALETKVLPLAAKSGSAKNMRVKRTKRRGKLEAQVGEYMVVLQERYPHAEVCGASLATTDGLTWYAFLKEADTASILPEGIHLPTSVMCGNSSSPPSLRGTEAVM